MHLQTKELQLRWLGIINSFLKTWSEGFHIKTNLESQLEDILDPYKLFSGLDLGLKEESLGPLTINRLKA